MSKLQLIIILFFAVSGVLFCSAIYAQEITETANDKIDFVVRLGQGGFWDSRSPEHKLGGGQLALDIKPWDKPWVLSFTSEYYTNSPDPTHAYEIAGLYAINILYLQQMRNNEKLNYFVGGGVGRLDVPKEESDPDKTRTGNLVNLEAGINYLFYRKIGVYGVLKYLRAHKTENNMKVIDFNETIVLLGLTYSFSL